MLSAETELPYKEVIASGALPLLVSRLGAGNAGVVLEAAWALTNVASSEHCESVVNAGAVPALVAAMMHADAGVREQCMWALGNVAGDRVAYRDGLLSTPGARENLLLNLRHPENIKLLRTATWALSNFCRGKPAPAAAAVEPLLPALAALAAVDDAATVADALWGIAFLTDADEVTAGRLLEVAPGLGARLAAVLVHTDEAVVLPALRTVGNLASGAESLTQAVVDGGALTGLVPLLLSKRRNFRREAAWAVSNIAAGTHEQISSILATRGLLDAVLETMVSAEWHVRKEAAWVVCNAAAAGTPAHVCKIVAGGAIPPLVSVLASEEERMITVVLDAVGAILSVEAKLKADGNPAADLCRFTQQFEEQGLIQRLEELQAHSSNDVYEKAYSLLTKYFGDDDAGAEEPPQAADAKAGAAGCSGSGSFFAAAAADVPRTPTSVVAAAGFSFTGITFA